MIFELGFFLSTSASNSRLPQQQLILLKEEQMEKLKITKQDPDMFESMELISRVMINENL